MLFLYKCNKIRWSFPEPQFQLNDYRFPPFRKDRNSKGGGKVVFLKLRLIINRIQSLETTFSEIICIELTIVKKKWWVLSAYRQLKENKKFFFKEILHCLNQLENIYDNIFLPGHLNTDIIDSKCDVNNHFSISMDTFGLKNLMKSPTCFNFF